MAAGKPSALNLALGLCPETAYGLNRLGRYRCSDTNRQLFANMKYIHTLLKTQSLRPGKRTAPFRRVAGTGKSYGRNRDQDCPGLPRNTSSIHW